MISINRIQSLIMVAIIYVLCGGCTMHAAMDDINNNKYLSKEPYNSPNALYVGTWSANVPGTILCYRIYPNGTAKYCQNKWNGLTEKGYAKIFMDKDNLFIIAEPGAIFKIESYSQAHILATAYGTEYNFIPGIKSYACEEFLSN